jgi:hypothetical protein
VDPIATLVLQRDAEFRARSIQNGARLAGILEKAIDERTATASEKKAMVERLAAAINIPATKIREVLAGSVDLMPVTWIKQFASVLDLPEHVLSFAVSDDAGDFIRSLEPGRSEVEALVSNAVQSVITNCQCQQRADDDGAALLETVLSAAAAAVRG